MDWKWLCIYGSQNTFSVIKRRAAPLRPLKKIFSFVQTKKAWNYTYWAAKNKIFLRKGAHSPCNIHQGASPLDSVNASRKRSVCSLHSQLLKFPPPHVDNFPKPMLGDRGALHGSRYHLPVNRPPFWCKSYTQWPCFSLLFTPNDPLSFKMSM